MSPFYSKTVQLHQNFRRSPSILKIYKVHSFVIQNKVDILINLLIHIILNLIKSFRG